MSKNANFREKQERQYERFRKFEPLLDENLMFAQQKGQGSTLAGPSPTGADRISVLDSVNLSERYIASLTDPSDPVPPSGIGIWKPERELTHEDGSKLRLYPLRAPVLGGGELDSGQIMDIATGLSDAVVALDRTGMDPIRPWNIVAGHDDTSGSMFASTRIVYETAGFEAPLWRRRREAYKDLGIDLCVNKTAGGDAYLFIYDTAFMAPDLWDTFVTDSPGLVPYRYRNIRSWALTVATLPSLYGWTLLHGLSTTVTVSQFVRTPTWRESISSMIHRLLKMNASQLPKWDWNKLFFASLPDMEEEFERIYRFLHGNVGFVWPAADPSAIPNSNSPLSSQPQPKPKLVSSVPRNTTPKNGPYGGPYGLPVSVPSDPGPKTETTAVVSVPVAEPGNGSERPHGGRRAASEFDRLRAQDRIRAAAGIAFAAPSGSEYYDELTGNNGYGLLCDAGWGGWFDVLNEENAKNGRSASVWVSCYALLFSGVSEFAWRGIVLFRDTDERGRPVPNPRDFLRRLKASLEEVYARYPEAERDAMVKADDLALIRVARFYVLHRAKFPLLDGTDPFSDDALMLANHVEKFGLRLLFWVVDHEWCDDPIPHLDSLDARTLSRLMRLCGATDPKTQNPVLRWDAYRDMNVAEAAADAERRFGSLIDDLERQERADRDRWERSLSEPPVSKVYPEPTLPPDPLGDYYRRRAWALKCRTLFDRRLRGTRVPLKIKVLPNRISKRHVFELMILIGATVAGGLFGAVAIEPGAAFPTAGMTLSVSAFLFTLLF